MECSDFGKFTLLNHMGKGGVASVYRANDNEAGNIVAVKIFESSEKRSVDTIRRLRDREVQMLISIQHPNVVKYYESGNVEDSYYYTMEFVENSLLERMRSSEHMELVDKIHILRQSCNALQAIHHQGIVHRDIKPGNILLDQDPSGAIHVKVTDLGIAKHVSETDAPRDKSNSKVPGTPKYLSPEQIELKPVDGRADIFSLGIVAYEMLTGSTPYKAETSEEYLRANLDDTAAPMHHVNEDIPAFLNPMVERMLAKKREERYDSDTLARDLELTYQHLVSQAPLVERRNPESVYYVPPVTGEDEPEEEEQASSWWLLPAAALVLVVAGLVVLLKWPEEPKPIRAGAPIDLSQPHPPPADQLLERARQLIDDGYYWKAKGLLAGLPEETLNQTRFNELQELEKDVQTALARSIFDVGMRRIKAGSIKEARVIGEQIDTLFPRSGLGSKLEKKIQELEERIASQRKWETTFQKLQTLFDEEDWPRVVERATSLRGETHVEERKGILQNMVTRAMQHWQEDLLQTESTQEQIQTFLALMKDLQRQSWFQGHMELHRSLLEFKIAEAYARANDMNKAMQQAQNVIDMYPGTRAANKAQNLQSRIIQDGLLGPMNLSEFSELVQKNGFAGPIWKASVPENASQEIQKGILVLKATNDGGQMENKRVIIRPVRPGLGFELSVEFRADARSMAEDSEYFVGLEVRDRDGNGVSVNYDGAEYSLVQSIGGASGGSKLRSAFGDEGGQWHKVTLLYHYDIARLTVMIDGEKMGERDLELGVFQMEVFLQMQGSGMSQAAFRHLECK